MSVARDTVHPDVNSKIQVVTSSFFLGVAGTSLDCCVWVMLSWSSGS
jgi:hypothetical protein